ncbi:hypothetical protein [Brasilonema sp. UFV-L1]|nr:hypothetical protein [Brasilonema sp. UFV-L1]
MLPAQPYEQAICHVTLAGQTFAGSSCELLAFAAVAALGISQLLADD